VTTSLFKSLADLLHSHFCLFLYLFFYFHDCPFRITYPCSIPLLYGSSFLDKGRHQKSFC
jgi:hypothetical protein